MPRSASQMLDLPAVLMYSVVPWKEVVLNVAAAPEASTSASTVVAVRVSWAFMSERRVPGPCAPSRSRDEPALVMSCALSARYTVRGQLLAIVEFTRVSRPFPMILISPRLHASACWLT